MSKIAGELNAEMNRAVRDDYRVLFAEMVRKTGSNQSVLDRLVQEIHSLRGQVAELESSPLSEEALDILRSKNAQFEKELAVMHAKHPENSCYDVPTWGKMSAQINTLAAQNEAMRESLHKLACLGNGDQFGNSVGNTLAQEALNLPNLAAEVLKRRDAETLRRAINVVETHRVPVGNSPAGELAAEWTMDALKEIRDELREMAAELEKETT